MLEGVCSIVEGLNPKLIRVKLEAFAEQEAPAAQKAAAQSGTARQPAAAQGKAHA